MTDHVVSPAVTPDQVFCWYLSMRCVGEVMLVILHRQQGTAGEGGGGGGGHRSYWADGLQVRIEVFLFI